MPRVTAAVLRRIERLLGSPLASHPEWFISNLLNSELGNKQRWASMDYMVRNGVEPGTAAVVLLMTLRPTPDRHRHVMWLRENILRLIEENRYSEKRTFRVGEGRPSKE